jgi:hypothetical protein
MEMLPARSDGSTRDPWELLDSRAKAERLRSMLEAELGRMLPAVLTPA